MAITKKEATSLARALAHSVDRGLKDIPRDATHPPSDGQIAVMVVMGELERLGYVLQKKA